MKLLGPTLVALCAAAPVPAGAVTRAVSIAPPHTLAVRADFAGDKAEFEARVRRDMHLWRRRMHETGVKNKAELNRAWTATKEEWASLQQATAESWDRSRAAYERAVERLKQDWQKDHPNEE